MAALSRAEVWGVEDVIHPEARKDAKEFECSVCLGIWHDPVQTAECHHIFCRGCVQQLRSCPTCRSNFEPKSLQPLQKTCQHLVRVLNKLPVLCPFRKRGEVVAPEDGLAEDAPKVEERSAKRLRVLPRTSNGECMWTGCYSDLAPHLALCEWNVIVCPHGCGEALQRRRVEEHSRECPKNWIVCELCGQEVRPWLLESHGKEEAFRHFEVLQKKVEKMETEGNKVSALSERVAELKQEVTQLGKQVANLGQTGSGQEEVAINIPDAEQFVDMAVLILGGVQKTKTFRLGGKGDFYLQVRRQQMSLTQVSLWVQLKTPPGMSLRVQLRALGACTPAVVTSLIISSQSQGTSDGLTLEAPPGGWKAAPVQILVQLLQVVQVVTFG